MENKNPQGKTEIRLSLKNKLSRLHDDDDDDDENGNEDDDCGS